MIAVVDFHICHSPAGGNPGKSRHWIPATQGMATYSVFPQQNSLPIKVKPLPVI
jgi:hypothetical protein